MNKNDEYQALINEICTLSLISEPERFYESANFKISDVDFTLHYQDRDEGRAILIYGDMGALPARNRDSALLALMDINFHMFAGAHSPAFSWNAQTGRVLLMGSIGLERATAEGVLLLMKSFADLAREWREHGFMGPVGTASAPVNTPASKATMRDTPASSGRFQ
ncbi:CesT family type III secretion system chaperone [Pseudomonas syringae]|uniref:CesT family type III secretion system chaperone n=1 Tax=Pseudomonas syringae TaxID=317 RepID=UPI0018E5C4FE|nr:CesT family type III secretion system chaperone [Pseudomonas syringae]MBI6738805.1 CesT family type III secretion system chaperone [Pseudomonas syringae]MBI6744299.1 CesT family type III secretion system chaperone [Pseudomonas syringae]MBI6761875.1 CesT family type III secretion system chaperone [Pseudomonas syringae]MBI6806053.1 CesT family type III secretion system chaperone [Pseudomonas syringae]MBI6827762.1 CesT family type III secretion system chaperone [Pseudomonas syringae]